MPESVREFAPAKINLALHVLGRRADGYHELDSAVAFASVGDELHITAAADLRLEINGRFADGLPTSGENLILKAHAGLATLVDLPSVHVKLTKNLPVASGIGGGSADAAAMLRGLLKLTGAKPDRDALNQVALSLGADVPVCLHGIACRMRGVGDVITPLQHLPTPAIVLVNPLKPCSTAEVFRGMGLKAGDQHLRGLDELRPDIWRNDMTEAALKVQPAIVEVLALLRKIQGSVAVRMSGSGATCFALFESEVSAHAAAALITACRPDWWVEAGRLS
jgi:4-diphosphocytidyl-2-C-methyl-D-erythritol kinase